MPNALECVIDQSSVPGFRSSLKGDGRLKGDAKDKGF